MSPQVFHPMPDTNACQLVLKYLLLNRTTFCKAYHDRLYYFSSGSKFMQIGGALQEWITKGKKKKDDYDKDPDPEVPAPKCPDTILKRYCIMSIPHLRYLLVYVYVIITNTSTSQLSIVYVHDMHTSTSMTCIRLRT